MDELISSRENEADNFCGTSEFVPVEHFPFPLISRLRRQLPPRGKPLSRRSFCFPIRVRPIAENPKREKNDEGDCKYFFDQLSARTDVVRALCRYSGSVSSSCQGERESRASFWHSSTSSWGPVNRISRLSPITQP